MESSTSTTSCDTPIGRRAGDGRAEVWSPVEAASSSGTDRSPPPASGLPGSSSRAPAAAAAAAEVCVLDLCAPSSAATSGRPDGLTAGAAANAATLPAQQEGQQQSPTAGEAARMQLCLGQESQRGRGGLKGNGGAAVGDDVEDAAELCGQVAEANLPLTGEG